MSLDRTIYINASGPADLRGKEIKVQGTINDVMGVANIWTDPRARRNPAMANYLKRAPPMTGIVYYGKIDGLGYCVHEDWLQKERGFRQEEKRAKSRSPWACGVCGASPTIFRKKSAQKGNP